MIVNKARCRKHTNPISLEPANVVASELMTLYIVVSFVYLYHQWMSAWLQIPTAPEGADQKTLAAREIHSDRMVFLLARRVAFHRVRQTRYRLAPLIHPYHHQGG